MARKLTGQLDPPKKGRPHFSLRVRVNGKHRRFDLGTADPFAAAQERDRVIATIEAERQKVGANGHKRESVKRVRKVAKQAQREFRTFPACAERFWKQQEADGVKTHGEQRSMFERFVLPNWTGDVGSYSKQAVRDLIGGLEISYRTRLNVFTAISGVFNTAVLGGHIEANPCKQVKRSKLVPRRRTEDDQKVRATLNAEEVSAMVAWEHPEEQHQEATRRTQDKLLIAFYTGLRHHEIAALRWEDIEQDFAVLTVHRAKKRDPAARLDRLDLTELPALRGMFRLRRHGGRAKLVPDVHRKRRGAASEKAPTAGPLEGAQCAQGGHIPEAACVEPLVSCAPETIRTSDQRFRKPLRYPLRYGG